MSVKYLVPGSEDAALKGFYKELRSYSIRRRGEIARGALLLLREDPERVLGEDISSELVKCGAGGAPAGKVKTNGVDEKKVLIARREGGESYYAPEGVAFPPIHNLRPFGSMRRLKERAGELILYT